MYADKLTKSIKSTIKITERRRKLQNEYNIKIILYQKQSQNQKKV